MNARACLLLLAVLCQAGVACDRAPSTPMQQPEPASAPPSLTSAASLPSATATPTPSASAVDPAPTASAPPPPLPHVKIENIGMHIGGGPNDAVNKAPIADSVAPHFDEVRACWTRVDDPARGGDFGVDLLIQPDGGRAKVTNPRTGIHPDAFRECVVAVFEKIDFQKPKKGLTMVSYSLRFSP